MVGNIFKEIQVTLMIFKLERECLPLKSLDQSRMMSCQKENSKGKVHIIKITLGQQSKREKVSDLDINSKSEENLQEHRVMNNNLVRKRLYEQSVFICLIIK